MVAQDAGLGRAAQGQQEEGVGFNHLVGLHGGQGTRGLHLHRLPPGLLDLEGEFSGIFSYLYSNVRFLNLHSFELLTKIVKLL